MSETPDQASRSLHWSQALFDGLVEGGMRQLVVSPGSRSTPLVLAAQRQPALDLSLIVDERSAAFFALGAARSSGRPVGLVCTSGSAPAHWLPAVVEASEAKVPLILLSADRPPELRGWGANQTIDQTRLFGPYVREFHDPGPAEDRPEALKMMRTLGIRATSMSLGSRPGPVHLNLPFREPLVPTDECLAQAPRDLPAPQTERREQAVTAPFLIPAALAQDLAETMKGCGLICCGPGGASPAFATALWDCASQLALPVLCDPLSGLRFGSPIEHRITRYDSLLLSPSAAAALRPDWILRFGRPPVSKRLLKWMADIPTILVDPGESWSDPNHDVRIQIAVDPAGFCAWLSSSSAGSICEDQPNADWLERWSAAERQLDRLTTEYLAQATWCEGQLITDLLDLLPEAEGLLCANSLPIRQLDTWSGNRTRTLKVFGNRGASGIDGQTSTLAGLNAGGTPTTGLLGDLSFLHDLSGLLPMRQLARPCIVLNNGGGRLFDYLPQRGLPGFEPLWRTPISLDIGELLRPFGIPHRLVEDGAGLRQALTETLGAGQDAGVIEARIDAQLSQDVHEAFWSQVRAHSLTLA